MEMVQACPELYSSSLAKLWDFSFALIGPDFDEL